MANALPSGDPQHRRWARSAISFAALLLLSPSAATASTELEFIGAIARSTATQVTIWLSQPTTYRFRSLPAAGGQPERVYIDLDDTRLPPGANRTHTLETGPAVRIRTAQFTPTRVRVVLDLKHPEPFTVDTLRNPFRIILHVGKSKSSAAPKAKTSAAKATPKVGSTALSPFRIIIDPGHGGRDPGAPSGDGSWEKDIVLDVSRQLATRVRQRLGLKAVLTRESDETVSIAERAAFARRGRALLVSVHANACPEPWVEGVQTFYAPVGRHASESRRLAHLVHHHVVSTIDESYGPVHDGGVRPRQLGVLRYSHVPGLLLETAYLSNPADRQRLADPAYQRAMIDGIVDGIEDYLNGAPEPLPVIARR